MFSFFETRGKGSAAGTRKEHIPGNVKTAFQTALKKLDEMRTGEAHTALEQLARNTADDIRDILKSDNPLSNCQGVGTIVPNLRNAIDKLRKLGGKNLVDKYSNGPLYDLINALRAMPDLSHVTWRVGNEVIFSAAELVRDGDLDDHPELLDILELRDVRDIPVDG